MALRDSSDAADLGLHRGLTRWHTLAIVKGSVVRIPVPKTIADGAQTTHLGALNFEIIRTRVTDILTVSDAQLITALEFLATQMKLVVEPTGCLALAAVRALGQELAGQRVGVILSGGNGDPDHFAKLLSHPDASLEAR